MRLLLEIFLILAHLILQLESQSTYKQEQCLRGTDTLTAAGSCREIIISQPDCLGAHASGTFWLKFGGAPAQRGYCDLTHSGGGWLKVVSFHHDGNDSCPSYPEAQLAQEWEGVSLSNGSLYCLKGGWREGEGGRSIIWNSERNVSYSEVRGYVQLRLISMEGGQGEGDGFRGPNYDIWEDDFADGLTIELLDTHLRHIYSYIIGSETRKCPEAQGIAGPPYLNNGGRWYACGHINSDDDIDGNGVYQRLPHAVGEGGGCQECSTRSPWFHHNIGEQVSHPISLRLIDYHSHPGVHTAVADLELYVR